tara:strand:+ start:3437 stop:4021 length:585 start_codon:yes stop_codon:yes gene_type:complete
MENIIITSIKKPKFDNTDNTDDLNFLNNNEECIICSQNIDLENLEYVIIINNLCKCYNAVKICQNCLFRWISINNQCFICRKSNNVNYSNRHKIYHTTNDDLKKKLVECTKNTQYSSIEIDGNTDENIPNDIRILQTRDIFTTSRTFRMWLNERRYTFFRYMLCYLFITMMFISIDKTIKYQNMDYNETSNIIW